MSTLWIAPIVFKVVTSLRPRYPWKIHVVSRVVRRSSRYVPRYHSGASFLIIHFNPEKCSRSRFFTRPRRTSFPGVSSRPDGCFKAALYIPFRVTAIFPTRESPEHFRARFWGVISGDMPRVKQDTWQLGVDLASSHKVPIYLAASADPRPPIRASNRAFIRILPKDGRLDNPFIAYRRSLRAHVQYESRFMVDRWCTIKCDTLRDTESLMAGWKR